MNTLKSAVTPGSKPCSAGLPALKSSRQQGRLCSAKGKGLAAGSAARKLCHSVLSIIDLGLNHD
jgi:hypothetical protein